MRCSGIPPAASPLMQVNLDVRVRRKEGLQTFKKSRLFDRHVDMPHNSRRNQAGLVGVFPGCRRIRIHDAFE
jgi:hypothetical protein